MDKIALLTLNGNYNYGNKLQHYALQEYLRKQGKSVETVYCYTERKYMHMLKDSIKLVTSKRFVNFFKFDKLIKYSKMYMENNSIKNPKEYEYYIIGSDQVWNATFKFFSKEYLLYNVESNNKISYASSFGINKLPEEYENLFKENLEKFKYLSVREDAGKKIIEDITGRKDVEVLIDPTMLLTVDDWDKVAKKPKQLKTDKYILNYFLGELSEARKKEIQKIADENGCEIINILDKNSPFYCTGPNEFLYLEKNAFLICTDSFHSSVFAILYNRPFVVFDRVDNEEKMNSRIETLISKFNLKNREYNNKNITPENLNHDYTEAYKVLKEERKKSEIFLKAALDIEKGENLNGQFEK